MAEQSRDYAARIMALFEGYSDAYGTYQADAAVPNDAKGGKLEIKSTVRTIRNPVTIDLWLSHLAGESPLGIIPIRDNDTCLWGCIDIDTYDLELSDIPGLLARYKLPLVPCRSKSGGVHLFLFLREPAPAAMVQMRLHDIAAQIGYGNAEVFPKQRTVNLGRGDLGSWLNMPYFRTKATDRYMVKSGGLSATLEEFVWAAEAARQGEDFLVKRTLPRKPDQDPLFGDGPPCMQHLAGEGFPQGTRNKGLFALATFAKKKYGQRWTEVLEQWNHQYFDPPLPAEEVLGIIKQHERKDYNYTCREFPLSAHCNSALCRTRRYGVGGDESFPVISGLSVLGADPPIWFMNVGSERIELSTDELLNYRQFHKRCMEQLHVCYRMMKQDDWMTVVAEATRDVNVLDLGEEVTRLGQFTELMHDFLTGRRQAQVKEDLLLGAPWEDVDGGRYYFRMRDFHDFLDARGFKLYSRPQMASRIRDMGGGRHFFNLRDQGVNVWFVPAMAVAPAPEVVVPDPPGDPI